MRTIEDIIEIMEALSDEDYALTKNAADAFYKDGNKSLLKVASKKTGLEPEEILWMW